MNVKMCDACKKVLGENDIEHIGIFLQRFEVCKECNKTAQIIKAEYKMKEQALEQSHQLLVKAIIDEFKEIGIEVKNNYE